MHTLTHEPVASTGAAIVPFPIPDDKIETVTGLPLVDCDPKVIARRLGPKTWKQRARFFNNIICESLANSAEMLDYARSQVDGGDFLEWACVEMMRRIGEVLDLWGDAEPADADAAALFLLSLNPKHQRAARGWLKKQKEQPAPRQFIDAAIDKRQPTLAIFYRMATIGSCAYGFAWRAGPQECSDDWFDLSKVRDAADAEGGDDVA